MCGACGSGTVRAPWETVAHGTGPRALAERAAQAQRLLGGAWRVAAFGPAGYTVTAPTGASTVHRDLDGLLAQLAVVAGARQLAERQDTFVARAVRDARPG